MNAKCTAIQTCTSENVLARVRRDSVTQQLDSNTNERTRQITANSRKRKTFVRLKSCVVAIISSSVLIV